MFTEREAVKKCSGSIVSTKDKGLLTVSTRNTELLKESGFLKKVQKKESPAKNPYVTHLSSAMVLPSKEGKEKQ